MKMIFKEKYFALVLTLLSVIAFSLTTIGATHVVSKDEAQFSSIQAAIDTAQPGDTVLVKPGEYTEAISLKDGINLKGEGKEKTKLVSDKDRSVINAEDVVDVQVSGFRVEYTGSEDNFTVEVRSSENVKIKDSVITGATYAGIAVGDNSTNIKVVGNVIKNNGQGGIFIFDKSKSTVKNNEIFANVYSGIEIKGESNPLIENNLIRHNKQSGIFINRNGKGHIKNNEIRGNNYQGISIKNALDPLIESNVIKGNEGNGIWIHEKSKKVTIKNNEISGNYDGIEVSDQSKVFIKDNSIRDSDHWGIRLVEKGSATINSNIISRNGFNHSGITLWDHAQALITENTVLENKKRGIELQDNAQATIVDNEIKKHKVGLLLQDRVQVTLKDSIFQENELGIDLSTPYRNLTGHGNQFTNNDENSKGLTESTRQALTKTPSQQESKDKVAEKKESPQELVVFPESSNYSSIQQAVDEATPGDKILVKPGTYEENLTINKSLTIVGENKKQVEIVGRKKGNPVLIGGPQDLQLTVKNLTINGAKGLCEDRKQGLCATGILVIGKATFSLTQVTIKENENGGIELRDSVEATVTDSNIINSGFYGIKVRGEAKLNLEESTIEGSKLIALDISDNAQATVRYNSITNNQGVGLSLATASKVSIKGNLILENDVGVKKHSGAKVEFVDNKIEDNVVDLAGDINGRLRENLLEQRAEKIVLPNNRYPSLQHAIDALLPGGTIVVEEEIQGGAVIDKPLTIEAGNKNGKITLTEKVQAPAVSLINGSNFTLDGIEITSPNGNSIISGGNANLEVFNSSIIDSSTGLHLLSESSATIKNSKIDENHWGISASDSARVSASGSSINDNDSGLVLFDSAKANVAGCEINKNENLGLDVYQSAKLTIKDTEIAENGWSGLRFSNSTQASILNSNIKNNGDDGVNLSASTTVNIVNSKITGNEDRGIVFGNSVELKLRNNVIQNNEVGVKLFNNDSFEGTVDGYNNQIDSNKTKFKGIKQETKKKLQGPPDLCLLGFKAIGKQDKALLSWTNPKQANLKQIEVRRQEESYPQNRKEGEDVSCVIDIQPGAPNRCRNARLEPGKKYYYSVFIKNSDNQWVEEVFPQKNAGSAVIKGKAIPRVKSKSLVPLNEDHQWKYSVIFKQENGETIGGSGTSTITGERQLKGETVTIRKIVTEFQDQQDTTFYFLSERDSGLYRVGAKTPTDIEPQVFTSPRVLFEYPVGVGYGWKTPMTVPIPGKEIVVEVNETVTSIDSQVTVPAGNYKECVKTEFSGSKTIEVKEASGLGISGYNKKKYLIEVEGNSWAAPGVGSIQSYTKISSYDTQSEELQSSLTMIEKLEEFEGG